VVDEGKDRRQFALREAQDGADARRAAF